MALAENLQKYTYSYWLSLALGYVPDTVDKREGSVIFDALSPLCYLLAEATQQLYNVVQDSYVLTATGEWLDMRTMEFGVSRMTATAAVKRADFVASTGNAAQIPIGSRWSTVSSQQALYYTVTAPYVDANGAVVPGAYQLTCDTPGIVGHTYNGPIVPVDYISGIASATMSTTLVPGRDVEDDDSLRQRYLARVNYRAFGGNIAQYREWLLDIPGIGAAQVYPVWDGPGTVKLSIVDTEFMPVSDDFVRKIQIEMDPENAEGETGTGIGMAPIDHKVTVTTPTPLAIDVTAQVWVDPIYSLAQLLPAIKESIDDYLRTLREEWGAGTADNRYTVSVFLAQIQAAILRTAGVRNISNTTLNGGTADLHLTETGQVQQIPVLGEVTLTSGE